ncbi:MAG: KamA family radical SAM protein [Deltaproteobacteria bacterium]|nr:KamA family radical SAM protein [Deltaproteobacteria bacterium]MCW8892247.1 KamA family radical SAM protein [Deltaproteobacteria bacterium]
MALEVWQQALKESLTSVAQLADLFDFDAQPLAAVEDKYPLRITPYYLNLIEKVGDPIWKQCVPDLRELAADGLADPLGEDSLSPVPAVIHRYPDRAIFLVSGSCAGYCRFCTRKRKVGCPGMVMSFRDLRDGIDYIAATPGIRDVILSGGDPLVLPDAVLEDLLARVHQIPHVEIIRIGTRVPVTLPERISEHFCTMLKKFHPLYLNTHFNHPRELTESAAQACLRLADAGIVLGNQTVLLRGVNDQPQIISALFRGLLKMRVRPYYLHHMDLAQGTAHFRTSVETGLKIMASLRGHVSGLALPYYVIDLPGGRGKVPLLPQDVMKIGDSLAIRTASGDIVEYPDLPSE